jgi:hypothetical protein
MFQFNGYEMQTPLGFKNLKITGSRGMKQTFRGVENADMFRKRVVESIPD